MRTEFACMSDAALRKLDVDTNGLSPAGAELRRRALGAKLGRAAGRSPTALLRELEKRKNGPDLRTPAERLMWLEARRHVTAHGVDPRQLVMQMYALRISQDF
jgi:hypothetical protein